MPKYFLALSTVLLALSAWFLLAPSTSTLPEAPAALATPEPSPAEASEEEVRRFCSVCHAYPPPETFPKDLWPLEVRRAYDFFRASSYRVEAPDLDRVVEYYRHRAPVKLPPSVKPPASKEELPVLLTPSGWSPKDRPARPAVTNVQLGPLFSDKLDMLVCQNSPGQVWAVRGYENPPSWRLLAELAAPAHVEVVDLDGDGHRDLIVADLGNFSPTDDLVGRVVWLKNDGHGGFQAITLLEGVGRVADVQAADFNGDGKLDLAVAEFGWQRGHILYLENQTTDWSKPVFRRTVLDSHSGSINVPVGDINGDGHADIVALLSQEHESVVAFLGDGKGHFEKKKLYDAPHPSYGSSSIQLVDLDGDRDLDLLYTNGDNLDPPHLLKPFHSVQWLENRGEFPFQHHHLAAQYGVMKAVAADIDGDGKLDVVSVAFLPTQMSTDMEETEGVLVLRQTARGKFERHVVEKGSTQHFTCAAGDVFGDGRVHLVVGSYFRPPEGVDRDWITVWRNQRRHH